MSTLHFDTEGYQFALTLKGAPLIYNRGTRMVRIKAAETEIS